MGKGSVHGTLDTPKEAARAHDHAAIKLAIKAGRPTGNTGYVLELSSYEDDGEGAKRHWF